MMRRMQQKDLQQKKQTEKQAIKALADSEFQEESVDPAELERMQQILDRSLESAFKAHLATLKPPLSAAAATTSKRRSRWRAPGRRRARGGRRDR